MTNANPSVMQILSDAGLVEFREVFRKVTMEELLRMTDEDLAWMMPYEKHRRMLRDQINRTLARNSAHSREPSGSLMEVDDRAGGRNETGGTVRETSTSASTASFAATTKESSLESRLRDVQELERKGLISPSEASELRRQTLGLSPIAATPGTRELANTGHDSGTPLATTTKSRTVAFLLSFFFGEFGADRFYVGHVGVGLGKLALLLSGVVAFATSVKIRSSGSIRIDPDMIVGAAVLWFGLGIWWLLDLILFLAGLIRRDGAGREIEWK